MKIITRTKTNKLINANKLKNKNALKPKILTIVLRGNGFLFDSLVENGVAKIEKEWEINDFDDTRIIIERAESDKHVLYHIVYDSYEPFDEEIIIDKKVLEKNSINKSFLDKIITYLVVNEEIKHRKEEAMNTYREKAEQCKILTEYYVGNKRFLDEERYRECMINAQKEYDEIINYLENILNKYKLNNVSFKFVEPTKDEEEDVLYLIRTTIY